MQLVNSNDLVLCLGDFNAEQALFAISQVSLVPFAVVLLMIILKDYWNSALGQTCGSWYCRKNIHRFSWQSNDHITYKEINHMLVSRRWNMVKNCRVYRRLECHTDHRPLIATCALKLKKQSIAKKPIKRFDVGKLQVPEVEYQYQIAIENRFSALAYDGSDDWDTFKEAYTKVAEEVLGLRKFTRNERISDRTRSLVEQKRISRLSHDMDKYKDFNRQCKRSARQNKQDWAEKKELQGETELASCQVKDAFANFRSLRAACPRKVSPVLDQDSNLVSDKEAKAKR